MTSSPVHGAPQSGDEPRASTGGLGLPARISEADLFRAVAGRTRLVRCVCSGRIEALVGNWDDITEAVRLHYGSELHRAWREWWQFVDKPLPVEVPISDALANIIRLEYPE